MKRGFQWALVVVVLLVLGWFIFGNSSNSESLENEINEGVFQEASLEAVGEYSGSGVAESSYVDGIYTHTVEAELEDPPADKFYEGWIVRKVPFRFISTGELTENSEGKYSLEFIAEEDYTNYKGVVITEETKADGLDGNPEAHVLEGDF